MPRTYYDETELEDSMEFFDEIEEADLESGVNEEVDESEYEDYEQPFDPRLFHPQLGPGTIVGEYETDFEEEEEGEEEIIGKGDSRSPIKNTTKAPYRWICRLAMIYQDASLAGGKKVAYSGTGTLISPRHVLTAAHNLQNRFGGPTLTAREVTVAPGQDRDSRPFGSAKMSGFKAPTEWTNNLNPCYDFALITLAETIGAKKFKVLGNKPLGCWSSGEHGEGTRLEFIDPDKLKKKTVHVAGYPGDKCGYLELEKFKRGSKCIYQPSAKPSSKLVECLKSGLHASAQFGAKGTILDPLPANASRLLLYDADTCKGHSGSPVWLQSGKLRYLIGVHTGPFDKGKGTCTNVVPGTTIDANRAVRISSNVLDDIHKWMR